MIDYKKDFKQIYGPYKKVRLVKKPRQVFIVVNGKGDPNVSLEFNLAIQTLYKFAYFIRMSYKKTYVVDSYEEFKVFPLEGNWTGTLDSNQNIIKSTLIFELMLALPDFVTLDVFNYYYDLFCDLNPDFDLSLLKYVIKKQHYVVCATHFGPFDTEKVTFDKIRDFINENNLSRVNKSWHKEIYLSDFRRVDPSKYKTILVCEVEHN